MKLRTDCYRGGTRVIPSLNQITSGGGIAIHFFSTLCSVFSHSAFSQEKQWITLNFGFFLSPSSLTPSFAAGRLVLLLSLFRGLPSLPLLYSLVRAVLSGPNCVGTIADSSASTFLLFLLNQLVGLSSPVGVSVPTFPDLPGPVAFRSAYDSLVPVASIFRHIYKSTCCRHLLAFPLSSRGVNPLRVSSISSLCILIQGAKSY